MTRACARLSVVLLASTCAAIAARGVHAATATPPVAVSVDRATISTKLGHSFVFRSTITNRGSRPANDLIAHLNVLSLRNGTYVDPEDWSSHRTRYLAPIPAGRSTTVTWKMEAVNSGSFGVYVAVLPRTAAFRPPATGPAIHIAVAERRTLNSGGVVPLAIGVPALLAAVWLAVRSRRRWQPA
jgi:hypothetical protein